MIKRGQLSSGQLALLILAIAGFAIAAMFLWGVFGNKDLSERDLCRLSIISRATVPNVAQNNVPLNCFTEKICITVDKTFTQEIKGIFSRNNEQDLSGAAILGDKNSDCKQFAGEKDVRTVKVSLDGLGNQEKAKETIQREVANSMFDCWMMTGQGKMDIFSKYDSNLLKGLAEASVEFIDLKVVDVKPACIVCSRVAFSDALTTHKENESLKGIDYNNFMSREKVPGSSLTYFQAFTDESVGAGYGTIGSSEDKLAKYYSYTAFNDTDVEEIRKILREQIGTQLSAIDKEKIDKLDPTTIKKRFDILSKSTKSKDNQIAIVFTQIKVPSIKEEEQFWNTFKNGAIVGGFSMISGPGKIASWFIPGPGWAKALVEIAAVGATSLNLAFNAESTTHTNQALSAATCGKFQSKITAGEQQGCSLVKLVQWDVDTINTLCTGGIEGNL